MRGAPPGRRPVEQRPATLWAIAKAKRLRESGVRVPDIAKTLGVSEFTVYPWLRWSGTGNLYPKRKAAR